MPYGRLDRSPESDVIHYESINERQMAISGEHFPEQLLVVCNHCKWCYTCFNLYGLIDICPICQKKTSNRFMKLLKLVMTIKQDYLLDLHENYLSGETIDSIVPSIKFLSEDP